MSAPEPPPLESRFRWSGFGVDGARRRGTLIAATPGSARAALRRDGITVVALEARGAAPPPRVRAHDVTRFARQLASLLQAGLPLAPALDLFAQATARDGIARIADGLGRDIVAGRPLSDALRRYPRQFGPLFRQLILIGEQSGTLATVLARLADDRERAAAQRSRVRAALAYPGAVLSFACALTAALLLWVVPTFAQIFEGFGATLPAPTRVVLALSGGLARWGPPAALGAALTVVAAGHARRRSAAARLAAARLALRIPLAGPLLRTLAAARWSRALGTLLGAGTPLVDAFASLAQASGNPVFDQATADIARRLQRGERLANAMRAAACFPDPVVQPIGVAEETGTLDAMLVDISTLCDRQVDERIDLLASVCEPLVIVVLGALVGALVIAMYLPIVQLGNVV
jgi:type IV pilus assembly protein PilC